jgi:hypothetical protein
VKVKTTAAVLVCVAATLGPAGTEGLLPEGFPVTGVDGRLVRPQDQQKWLFEFDEEVSAGEGDTVASVKRLEMLPSAALKKIVSVLKDHPDGRFRLWGRVCRYKGRNFIFPIYFLEVEAPRKRAVEPPAVNEPEDAVSLPKEITDRLQKRPVIRAGSLRKGLALEQDSTISDVRGLIAERPGGAVFIPDGLGRNIERLELRLLPCQTLERALRRPEISLSRPSFTVAGLLTRYEGRNYLLLERATRTYSCGNFGPSTAR